MVGGPSGNWIAPLVNPIKAMVTSPFVSQDLELILAQISQDDLEVVAAMMEYGKVRSVIDRQFDLSQTADAIRYSETGRARGKIIVRVSQDQPVTR
jgi:NADPH:quinone reductase-like Zn-dependent oxidoreductase